eukprot:m.63872 g.63872  ORF g.63872 m.63872 type:complete len:501 (-) comp8187_c0_seq1:694-2196(-)
MSIAEFYLEHGIDPGDPDSFDAFMVGMSEGHDDGAWCYRARHGNEWDDDDEDVDGDALPDGPTGSVFDRAASWQAVADVAGVPAHEAAVPPGTVDAGRDNTLATGVWEGGRLVPAPVPDGCHRGAVAPHWVLAANATNATEDDCMDDEDKRELYFQRLLAAVMGRFVVTPREGSTYADDTIQGAPLLGVRYTFRWWTPGGDVFDDNICKFCSNEASEFLLSEPCPGRFNVRREYLWLEQDEQDFWSAMWCWVHDGTTGSDIWDEALANLKSEALGADMKARMRGPRRGSGGGVSGPLTKGGRVLCTAGGIGGGHRPATKSSTKHWTCSSCKRKLAAVGFSAKESTKRHDVGRVCKICTHIASVAGTSKESAVATAPLSSHRIAPTHAECGVCSRTLAAAAFDASLEDFEGRPTCKICVRSKVVQLAPRMDTADTPTTAEVTQAATTASPRPLRCSSCESMCDPSDFSQRQRKKKSTERRCKACVARDPSTAEAYARVALL